MHSESHGWVITLRLLEKGKNVQFIIAKEAGLFSSAFRHGKVLLSFQKRQEVRPFSGRAVYVPRTREADALLRREGENSHFILHSMCEIVGRTRVPICGKWYLGRDRGGFAENAARNLNLLSTTVEEQKSMVEHVLFAAEMSRDECFRIRGFPSVLYFFVASIRKRK